MKIHVKLTEKDADIVAMKNFLPEGKFNETVIRILNAALRGEVARIPMEFEIHPLRKKSQTKIDLSEEMIERVKNNFGRGPFTTKVKMLIRRCIRANLKEVHTKRISMARGRYLFERTIEIAHKNDGLPDGFEKYGQLLKDRRDALFALVNQLNKDLNKERR